MTHRALTILLALTVAAAAADNPPPSPTPVPETDASSILLAPKPKDYTPEPPTDSDGVTRSNSPGIAAALEAGIPKFNPPTPTPTPAADPQDLRDIDKPKNGIKRLPKYVVRETRPPVFRDRDLYTRDGLTSLAFKYHPGLLFGNFLGLNASIARDMYQDDQRKDNMDDLSDTARAMATGGDAAEGSYILQQSQDTYMRRDDDWHLSEPGALNSGGWSK